MEAFLNLSQRPDLIEIFLKSKNFTEEEKNIIKEMLKNNSKNIGINIFTLLDTQ